MVRQCQAEQAIPSYVDGLLQRRTELEVLLQRRPTTPHARTPVLIDSQGPPWL